MGLDERVWAGYNVLDENDYDIFKEAWEWSPSRILPGNAEYPVPP